MTVAEGRALIQRSRSDRRVPSKVNPSMTHQQALDVLQAAIAGLADTDDLDAVRSGLMARNIRRETGATDVDG